MSLQTVTASVKNRPSWFAVGGDGEKNNGKRIITLNQSLFYKIRPRKENDPRYTSTEELSSWNSQTGTENNSVEK